MVSSSSMYFHVTQITSSPVISRLVIIVTGRSQESEQFLRFGYLPRLGTVIRFRQFAPERI
jgi:hypothetical protein